MLRLASLEESRPELRHLCLVLDPLVVAIGEASFAEIFVDEVQIAANPRKDSSICAVDFLLVTDRNRHEADQCPSLGVDQRTTAVT